MVKRKKKEMGMMKPAMGLVGGSVMFGLGGSIAETGGFPAAGITAGARFLPAAGAAVGAGMAMGQVKKLQKLTKRKK